MKQILCINYSQSGQLDDIISSFISPLEVFNIERIYVKPNVPYAFPWNTKNFYDPMPETVLEEPIELAPMELKRIKYDLIIFGYQPWFLSPSLPTSSLLQYEGFKNIMQDTPIITIIGARNMWINAQKSVVKHINNNGGNLIGNIALVDRAPNHLSAISIVHWMMTGEKEKKWGIFPFPGVSDKDIKECSRFGELLCRKIKDDDLINFHSEALKIGSINIKTSILFIERRAKKIFYIWADLIKKKMSLGKKRSFWIKFFRVYLNIALFGVAPVVLLIYTFIFRPFLSEKIKKQKDEIIYLGIKQ